MRRLVLKPIKFYFSSPCKIATPVFVLSEVSKNGSVIGGHEC